MEKKYNYDGLKVSEADKDIIKNNWISIYN